MDWLAETDKENDIATACQENQERGVVGCSVTKWLRKMNVQSTQRVCARNNTRWAVSNFQEW